MCVYVRLRGQIQRQRQDIHPYSCPYMHECTPKIHKHMHARMHACRRHTSTKVWTNARRHARSLARKQARKPERTNH